MKAYLKLFSVDICNLPQRRQTSEKKNSLVNQRKRKRRGLGLIFRSPVETNGSRRCHWAASKTIARQKVRKEPLPSRWSAKWKRLLQVAEWADFSLLRYFPSRRRGVIARSPSAPIWHHRIAAAESYCALRRQRRLKLRSMPRTAFLRHSGNSEFMGNGCINRLFGRRQILCIRTRPNLCPTSFQNSAACWKSHCVSSSVTEIAIIKSS